MRRIAALTTLTIVVLLWSGIGQAQETRRGQALKRIEMLRVWRLTEMLNLSAEDGAKVFPVLRSYDKQFHKKGREKDKLLRKLRAELKKETKEDKVLRELREQVMRTDSDSIALRKKMYEDLRQVFTEEQTARYMLFEISFQRELDDLVGQVRRERPRSLKAMKKKKSSDQQ